MRLDSNDRLKKFYYKEIIDASFGRLLSRRFDFVAFPYLEWIFSVTSILDIQLMSTHRHTRVD